MQSPAKIAALEPANLAGLDLAQVLALVRTQAQTIAHLQHQLDWFKRQLFGAKSERFIAPDPLQMHLGEVFPLPPVAPPAREKTIPAHTRKAAQSDLADSDAESLPFFDESKVPVETIAVVNEACAGLAADQFEVIGEKISHRLAQRPASYVVLKYVRPVIKLIETQKISCPPAPRGVIEGSRADVSFCAGMLIDKFVYHQPLYRQHQKLDHNGIRVSRPWLTQIAKACIALLEPIYDSQFDSIRASRVIAMDETAIKAGHDKGKMKAAFFWPVYGDRDEVCFPFFTSRSHQCVVDALGVSPESGAVLLSDGYAAYASYAKKTGLTHAQCWAHTRREFFEAQAADPDAVASALQQIGQIYVNEKHIREHKLTGLAKRDYRLDHSKPVLAVFFDWIERQFQRQGLLPSNPFTKALAYARERRVGLEVFLTDPEVPVDTNHLERALRVIPMGRNYAERRIMRSACGDLAARPSMARFCSRCRRVVLSIIPVLFCRGHVAHEESNHGCRVRDSRGSARVASAKRLGDRRRPVRVQFDQPELSELDHSRVRRRRCAYGALDDAGAHRTRAV